SVVRTDTAYWFAQIVQLVYMRSLVLRMLLRDRHDEIQHVVSAAQHEAVAEPALGDLLHMGEQVRNRIRAVGAERIGIERRDRKREQGEIALLAFAIGGANETGGRVLLPVEGRDRRPERFHD